MDAKKVIEEALKNAVQPVVAAVTDDMPADAQPGSGEGEEAEKGEGDADNADGEPSDGDAEKGEGVKEEDVIEAVKLFLKGPKWRKIYDDAPENAKNRLALNFYWSACKDKPGFDRAAYLSLRTKLEEALKWDDVVYMISTAQNDLAKKHYRRLLSALKDEDEPAEGGENGETAAGEGQSGEEEGDKE